ncbi:NupC family nucleoside transporter [Apiospora arundinis]
MLVKSILRGALLLGSLVAALPNQQVSESQNITLGEDDLASYQTFEVRAEKEEICQPKNCGKKCKRGVTLGDTVRSHLSVARDNTVNYLSGIQKRALDRPATGKIDEWFAKQWPRLHVDVPIEMNDEEIASTSRYVPFLKEPVRMGLKGLYGCTSVIIADKKGAYMSHHWETYFTHDFKSIAAGKGETKEFTEEIVDYLQDVGCIFSKTNDPSTQVVIFTKQINGEIKYKDQIGQMKEELVSLIPGLETKDIKEVGYASGATGSSDPKKAEGKIIVTYDNKANAAKGEAAFEVWAGSRTPPGKPDRLPPDQINDPIMKGEWKQLDNQK